MSLLIQFASPTSTVRRRLCTGGD